MAKRVREERDDCIRAFTDGNPVEAEQLLSCIPQSGVKFVTTTFKFSDTMITLVSLLHLAAYWGWKNVVTTLVSVYKCDANCKDEEGHIPLHYAPIIVMPHYPQLGNYRGIIGRFGIKFRPVGGAFAVI